MTKSPPSPSPTPTRRLRRNLRRTLFGLLGLFVILLIVFLLLPQWISNDQGRLYILQKLNARIHGTANVADWSFGWFHGSELTDVKITLPDDSTPFACHKIHSDLTLWSILCGNYDLGTTTLDGLQLSLTKDNAGHISSSPNSPPPSSGPHPFGEP